MPPKPKTEPPKESRWRKGQSGNPGGRPKTPPEIKVLANLTKAELVTVGTMIVKGTMADIQAMSVDPKASVLQTMIGAVCVTAVRKGDMGALNQLLDRIVGRVKEEVEHSGIPANTPPAQVVITLPSNGRQAEENQK